MDIKNIKENQFVMSHNMKDKQHLVGKELKYEINELPAIELEGDNNMDIICTACLKFTVWITVNIVLLNKVNYAQELPN